MSYIINGQRYSYDYEELIEELKEDLEYGDCKPSSIIQIVRDENSQLKYIGYKPIIDYYLPRDIDAINVKLEEIYNKDEFSENEWANMEKGRLALIEQYRKDKEKMEKMTVTAVLTEMEMWNSIL